MAIFDENKLKDEEIKSGFQPGEPDDDSFLLESQGTYPGKFPTFDDPEPESFLDIFDETPENSEVAANESPVESNEDSGSSIWDQFESDSPEITTPTQTETTENITEEAIPTEIDNSIAEDKENPPQEESPIVNTQVDNASSNIVFDDDFKKQLEEELKQKQAKKAKKNIIEEEPLIEIPPDPNFKPVEERERNFEYIDLGNLSGEGTSENLGNISGESIPVIEKKKAKAPKEKKIKESKPQKEKKKKGLVFWLFLSAAILAVFTVATYFSLDYIIKTPEKNYQDSLKTAHKATKQIQNKEKNENKAEIKDTNTVKKEESAKIDTVAKEKTNPPGNEIAKNEEKPKLSKEEPITQKENKIVKNEEKNPQISRKIPNYSYAPPIKPKRRFVPKTNVEHKTQQTKDDNLVETIQEDKTSRKETAVYTIQVYSTPSYEDAKIWLDKLLAMNISTARIVQQKIRDLTWYRVRFGNYPTKDEAINAAKRLGFSQTWVDRIK